MNKKCTGCGNIKESSEFYVLKNRKGGHQSQCKECTLKKRASYYAENKEQEKEKDRKWAAENRESIAARKRKRYSKNPRPAIERAKRWKEKNPAKVRAIDRKRMAKYNGTAKGRLSSNISVRLRQSLLGSKANRHWEELVGFTVDQLRIHLEKRFKPGMTWENYGTFWQVDHKIPIAVFNYEKPEDIDFRICWSLKNLQPLGKKENASKCAKIEKPFQPALAM